MGWAQWMPLAFWAVHRTFTTGRLRTGLAAGLFVALQGDSSIYYLVCLASALVIAAPFLIWHASAGARWPAHLPASARSRRRRNRTRATGRGSSDYGRRRRATATRPRKLPAPSGRWPEARRRVAVARRLAAQPLDPPSGSARLVPVVLPVLHGSQVSGRCQADEAMAGDRASRRGHSQTLRTTRLPMPQSSTAGSSSLGIRQPDDLK